MFKNLFITAVVLLVSTLAQARVSYVNLPQARILVEVVQDSSGTWTAAAIAKAMAECTVELADARKQLQHVSAVEIQVEDCSYTSNTSMVYGSVTVAR